MEMKGDFLSKVSTLTLSSYRFHSLISHTHTLTSTKCSGQDHLCITWRTRVVTYWALSTSLGFFLIGDDILVFRQIFSTL